MLDTNRKPLWKMTAEERRESKFQRYCESKHRYNDAIEAAGDIPWHEGDADRRRELFDRRYAPVSMPSHGVA